MKLLDTNIVSLILKGDPRVCAVLVKQPMYELCISSVTEGELAFGLAKRGHPAVLTRRVQEFLLRVDALPFLLTTVGGNGVPLEATQCGLADRKSVV